MIQDKTFLTQGSSMQRGVSPLGGETFLWTAAMVVREVILLCPEKLEMEERKEYFSALAVYLKDQMHLAEEKAANLNQVDFRTPWLVAMCGYVYNRTHDEAVWATSAYHQVFKFSRRASAAIATTLTEDLKLALNTCEINSSTDFFWLETIDRLNSERAKAGKEVLEPSSGPYPVPRAAEWDYIYDHFKADLRFSVSPPLATGSETDIVDLIPVDVISERYEQPQMQEEQPLRQGEVPANTPSGSNQGAVGSKGTKKRPRLSSSQDRIQAINTANSDDENQGQDDPPRNERASTSRDISSRSAAKFPAKKRRKEGPNEASTTDVQPHPSGSAKAKGKQRAMPVEEDVHEDSIDDDVRMISDHSDEETAAQKKTFIIISGDNTDPGALVYPFADTPTPNIHVLEWNENDLTVPLAFLSQIPFIKFVFVLQVAPIACTACLAGNLPCMMFLAAFHPCYGCKANGRGCSHCPRADNKNITDKEWCWWLTTIHHVANVLDLASRRGPRYVLPSYDGITFPPFPKELTKDFRISLSTKEIKDNWEANMASPPETYFGVPHGKVAKMNKEGKRPVRCRWPWLGEDTEEVTLDLYNVYSDAKTGILPRLWAVGYDDGWIKEASINTKPRGRPRNTTVKTILSAEAALEGRTSAQKPSAKSSSAVVRQPNSTQQARREYSRVPEDSGEENEPIVIEDTPPKKKATKTATARKAKAKQPKAGTSARGRRQQSPDEEESDVSEPRPSKGKGKAVASGSAKVTKATSRRIAEVSHAELPSIATNPRNEIEQLKLTVQRLEKKIDQLVATQPDPINENYIAEYVTGKVEEMFADVDEGPFSGLIAVLSQFEAVLTDSTKSESNRGDAIMRRHDALHRKVDTMLSHTGQLSGTESSLHSGSTVSQRIIDEIAPQLQHAVTTTVLQQVSAEVQRTMKQFFTGSQRTDAGDEDGGEEDPIQPSQIGATSGNDTSQVVTGDSSVPEPLLPSPIDNELTPGEADGSAVGMPAQEEGQTPAELQDETMKDPTDDPSQLETGSAQDREVDFHGSHQSDVEEEGEIME